MFYKRFINIFKGKKMSFNRKFLLTALGLTLAAVAPQASAGTATGQFDVKIQIVASCEITSSSIADLNFGQQGFSATNVMGETELKVTCTKGSPYSIALNAGSNAKDDTRRMKGTGPTNTEDFVAYNLYQDSDRTTVWGDGTSGTVLSSQTGTGTEVTHTIFGRVPTTNHIVGHYSDTVTATVTF